MPFLPTSGAISINDLNTFFTGSGTAMSNFYRGGGRVPSTKTTTTTTREPASGEFFSVLPRGGPPPTQFMWETRPDSFGAPSEAVISWDANVTVYGTVISGTFITGVPFNSTSHTVGNTTYYRGTFQESLGFDSRYAIYREISTSSTVNINTGIPASGQISLNQFYGAEVP